MCEYGGGCSAEILSVLSMSSVSALMPTLATCSAPSSGVSSLRSHLLVLLATFFSPNTTAQKRHSTALGPCIKFFCILYFTSPQRDLSSSPRLVNVFISVFSLFFFLKPGSHYIAMASLDLPESRPPLSSQ